MDVQELLNLGFSKSVCKITNDIYYKYDCNDYHITVSDTTYGGNDRRTAHIDGNDFSTIGFGYISSIGDLNMILFAIGEKTIPLN